MLTQGLHHAQNLVVCLALWQAGGQGVVQWLCLEHQLSARIAVASAVQLKAQGNVSAGRACQSVQRPAGLACVAGDFGHSLFVPIKLFEHDHRQINIVFLKAEQAHRIVQQDVGIEHEQFGWPGSGRLLALGRGDRLDWRRLFRPDFGFYLDHGRQ